VAVAAEVALADVIAPEDEDVRFAVGHGRNGALPTACRACVAPSTTPRFCFVVETA
jgi:hypothetical protein